MGPALPPSGHVAADPGTDAALSRGSPRARPDFGFCRRAPPEMLGGIHSGTGIPGAADAGRRNPAPDHSPHRLRPRTAIVGGVPAVGAVSAIHSQWLFP